MTLDAYEEECEFADPAGSFRGLNRFKRNCTNFGYLLERSNMKLMKWEDFEVRMWNEIEINQFLWLMNASMNFLCLVLVGNRIKQSGTGVSAVWCRFHGDRFYQVLHFLDHMRYELIVWMSDSLEFCSYWLYRVLLWWEIWKSEQVYYSFCCHCIAFSTILHLRQPVWWIYQACWALECAEDHSFEADFEAQQEAFGQDITRGSLSSIGKNAVCLNQDSLHS